MHSRNRGRLTSITSNDDNETQLTWLLITTKNGIRFFIRHIQTSILETKSQKDLRICHILTNSKILKHNDALKYC